jgi:membrane protease YdiL (CAAX protease family)
MVSSGITVTVLACLRWGPSWRTLLAIHPRVTLSLALAVAVMPPLTAAIAMPEAFRIAQFDPLPLDQLLRPILQVIAGSSCEEVSDRAFMQSQLSKLFFSKWAGALVSGWGFAMSHPPGRMALVLPAALLLVIVFMRTGSIFCTSVLHTTINASYGLVCLTNFTRSPFIPYETFNAANPLFGGMLLALTIAFEWWWRRSERARTGRLAPPPNERIPGFDPASLSP